MTGPIQLDWPNCLNVRDLGGLPLRTGGRTRAGWLIRSDNLSRLTPAGVEAVRRAGVRRIVDVRSPGECEGDPSPFTGEASYSNLPLAREGDLYDPALPLDQDYGVMLDRRPELFAAAVAAIADAPDGAVVVHCHAGKDRSGNVVALTLGLAGVTTEAIVADYATVSDRLRRVFDEQLALVDDEVARDRLAESFTARPETMLAVVRHVEESYGGVESYLRRGGLTGAQANAIRQRLQA